MLPTGNLRREIIGAAGAGAVIVSFCLLLLGHDPLLFWNDDYELSILPVFADVARSWNEGHLPLLSPYSWVCSNLAGEFQYGTFSIFINAVVVLIWKLPLAFAQQAAALSITHLFVLAAGAFLLARQRKLSGPLALLVALVATLNGWMICWGATDWFGALSAFAWLPWAWWGMERAVGEDGTSRWRFIWPAPFVYLVVTGGFPYTVVMLGLIAVWLAIRAMIRTRSVASIFPLLAGLILGFGLSAPAWLALIDYVQGSGRGATSALAHKQWVVPPGALPAFILPNWTVSWADFSTRYVPHPAMELACGLVAPVALITGLLWRGRELVRRIGWDLFLLSLLLSLSMLPSAGVFRWSFRWLPLIHLVLALGAAEALRLSPAESAQRWKTSGMIGLLLVIGSAIAMQLCGTAGPYAYPFSWIVLGISMIWAASEFLPALNRIRPWLPAVITYAVFLATYLCISPNCGVPKYNLARQLNESSPLDPERLYLSVYPQAEQTYRTENKPEAVGQVVRPGSTSMWGRLRFVNGYSPILAAGVAREFDFAIHGEVSPGVGDYLVRDQAGPAGILEQLGVDGLVIAQELEVDPLSTEWELVLSNDEGRVFHRRGKAFPTVRSVNWIDSSLNEEFVTAAVSGIHDSRNSVQANVDVPNGDRPALLTFSRPYFRGYQAKLGDKKLTVDSYRGFVPTVTLPPGTRGHLVLWYRPAWLVYGGAVAGLCALFLAGSTIAALRSSRGG